MNILQSVLLIMTTVLLCYSNTGVLSHRGNSLDRVLRYHLRTSKCKSRCLLRHTLSPEIESCWDRCSSNSFMEEDRIENNSGNFGRDNSGAPGWDIFPLPTPSNDCESIGWGELIPNYNYIGDMKKRSITSALQQTHPANVYLIMGQDQKRKWHLLSSTWTKSVPYPKGDKARLVLVVVDFLEGIKMKMRVPRCDEIQRRHPVKRSQFGMLKTSSHLESSAMYDDHGSIPRNKLIFLSLMTLLLTTSLVYAFIGLYKRCRPKNEGLIICEII
ncbi:uncharacterized protein [Lepeophtheirus salmonis]|uniref:uncharacterized protein n=1 Tax=Lepeophtheirus salmonis TaxID=72036 RepID=UPI003AF3763F